jgi:hypothetical protein
MLSSPGSEAEVKLLDLFIQRFADGRTEGIREDQVRSSICRDKVMTDVEVLRRLLEEADIERSKGQRGLTKFVTRWRSALAEKEIHWSQKQLPKYPFAAVATALGSPLPHCRRSHSLVEQRASLAKADPAEGWKSQISLDADAHQNICSFFTDPPV